MLIDRNCSQSNRPETVVVEYGKQDNQGTEVEDAAVVVAEVRCMNHLISVL